MKRILIILSILLAFLGCTKNEPESLQELLEESEFNAEEKKDIQLLVSFFESKMIDASDLEEGVQQSYEKLMIAVNDTGFLSITNKIEFNEQVAFYEKINASTFSEIWRWTTCNQLYDLETGVSVDEPISYQCLIASIEGKYVKLLKKIAKRDPKIERYVQEIMESGDFPMSFILINLLVDSELNWVNFENPKWKLIIAIQLLTINDQEKRFDYIVKSNPARK